MFTKKLKEDIFINMFLPLIFNKSLSNSLHKLNNKTYYFYKINLSDEAKNQFDSVRNDFNLKKNFLEKPDCSSLNAYYICGKIWILRYQRWLILLISIYTPKYAANPTAASLQLVKNSKKKDSKWWFFLKNYSDSLITGRLSENAVKISSVLRKKRKRFYISKKFKSLFYKKCKNINTYLKSRIFLIKLKKKKVLEKKLFFFLKKTVRFYRKELKFYKYKDFFSKKKNKAFEKSLKKQLESLGSKKVEVRFHTWQLNNQLAVFFENKLKNKFNLFF